MLLQAIQQLQTRTPHAQANQTGPFVYLVGAALDIFQTLIGDLDTEGRYLFLNAIANQLRYPNTHTHYFSFIVLYLFAESNQVRQVRGLILLYTFFTVVLVSQSTSFFIWLYDWINNVEGCLLIYMWVSQFLVGLLSPRSLGCGTLTSAILPLPCFQFIYHSLGYFGGLVYNYHVLIIQVLHVLNCQYTIFQQEIIQEQITRVLLERLIVNRPHPWGLLITFIELIKVKHSFPL